MKGKWKYVWIALGVAAAIGATLFIIGYIRKKKPPVDAVTKFNEDWRSTVRTVANAPAVARPTNKIDAGQMAAYNSMSQIASFSQS